jgi:Ca2+-binding RTX toxin-like protein
MANVTLHAGFSFMTHQDWYWDVTQYNSSSITISDGLHTQRFFGSFTFNYGRAYGNVSETEYYEGGKLIFSVTGMSSGFNDASRLQSHAETNGDTQATYAYVLGGNDSISGSSSKDVLAGYAGADKLDGKAGADILLGGAGNDTYYVDNTGDKVYETTSTTSTTNAGGIDKVVSAVSFSLAAYKGVAFVEHLTLSGSSAINGTGNSLANKITGNGAANTLNGGSGNDVLRGAAGNDKLYGDSGADTMLGGAGNDTYYVASTGDKVYETISTTSTTNAGGIDKVVSSVSFSLAAYKGVSFVEHLTLSGSSAINGTGNGLANRITGNGAANTLKGGSGNDSLSGGNGSDTLYGEKGNDTLYGNSGNDLLRGGAGSDLLYGGTGKDVFRLDAALSASTNVDRIRDFSVADDTIQLENAIFTRFGTKTGTIASGNFKASTSGRATDSNDYILYETDTGKIFYDADGNGAGGSVEIALVGTQLALTAADFILV